MLSVVAIADRTPKAVAVNKSHLVPLAFHDDVVNDASLFRETLRGFHHAMGTKYMVPKIGGKEVDLHLLYIEVTKRGGFEKVVVMKKWKEVRSMFTFPETTTNVTYALRKHYFNLLHEYEKVYFPKPNPSIHAHASSDPSTFQATVRVEAKFEHGYMVTLKLESETLRGVLYHSSEDNQQSSAILPHDSNSLGSGPSNRRSSSAIIHCNPNTLGAGPSNEKRRKKKRKNRGDLARPKSNRSGYNFYFAEMHAKLKPQSPVRERELTKMIGQSWKDLSQEEKLVYQKQGEKDKERYQRELAEYKERTNGMRQDKEAQVAVMGGR